jgi:rhamnogalacturonan acetylesterase
MKQKTGLLAIALIALCSFLVLPQRKPVVYIIGDSTVRNTNRPQCGWGEMISEFLDTTQIKVSNQAMAGRSTRTFIKEKRWEKVINAIQPGDYLIMQFGHNEGSKPDTSKAGYRGVLRGTGNDSVSLNWGDTLTEVVHSYGWYLRKFVREAKAKGATPVICSMIPRNQWADGKVKRADKDFGKWAEEIAKEEGVFFINLNAITADKYDALGPEQVKALFPGDHTHTNEEGAKINAASVTEGIRSLKALTLNQYLKNN